MDDGTDLIEDAVGKITEVVDRVIHVIRMSAQPPGCTTPASVTATIFVPTVHNWVQLVYRAFGHEASFPPDDAKNHVALLGVREAYLTSCEATLPNSADKSSDGSKQSAHTHTAAPITPTSPSAETIKLEKAAGKDDQKICMGSEQRESMQNDPKSATTYNDLLFCVWHPETTAADQQNHEIFQCSIDKGPLDDSHGTGNPLLLEGFLYRTRFTAHKNYKAIGYAGGQSAMMITSPSGNTVRLVRDADLAHRTLLTERCALVTRDAWTGTNLSPRDYWRFCREETNESIHIHGSGVGKYVAGWSTGCTVLRHGFTSDRYKRFLDVMHLKANAPPETTSIVKDAPSDASKGASKDTPKGSANSAPAKSKSKKKSSGSKPASKTNTAAATDKPRPARPAPDCPLLVVSSQYVVIFDEWRKNMVAAARAGGPSNSPPWNDPRSVIKTRSLRPLKGAADLYLPSFISDEFVQEVQRLIDSLRTCELQCLFGSSEDAIYASIATISFYQRWMPATAVQALPPMPLRRPDRLQVPRPGYDLVPEIELPDEQRSKLQNQRKALAEACAQLALNLERSLHECVFRMNLGSSVATTGAAQTGATTQPQQQGH